MSHFNADGTVSDAFAELMVVLAEAFGGRLTEAKIKTYAALLGDVALPDVARGFHRCARELDARFLPADPESRLPTVSQVMPFIRPTEPDAALLAWAAVRRAAHDVGAYESLAVDDKPTALALMACSESWPAFCALEEGPALAAAKGVFCAAYKQARRSLDATGPTRFTGLHEQQGHYVPGARVWVGRLLADGRVEQVRDQAVLTAGPVVNQLTGGTDGEGPGPEGATTGDPQGEPHPASGGVPEGGGGVPGGGHRPAGGAHRPARGRQARSGARQHGQPDRPDR